MSVVIFGPRDLWVSNETVQAAVDGSGFQVDRLAHGCATGVDRSASRWATAKGIPQDEFPADWGNIDVPGARVKTRVDGSKYNAAAGPQRNEAMAAHEDVKAGIYIRRAWRESSGSTGMAELLRKQGKPVHVHAVESEEG